MPNNKVLAHLELTCIDWVNNLLKCRSGHLHLNLTFGYQKSTSIFGRVPLIYHVKYPKATFWPTWDLSQRSFQLFTDLIATLQARSRVSNFNFDIVGWSIKISCKIPNCKVLHHLRFYLKVFPGYKTDVSGCVGFNTPNRQQEIQYQFRYVGCWEASLSSAVKIIQSEKFLPTCGLCQGDFNGL